MNRRVTIEVPDHAVELFGGDQANFARELFEAAVVQWYEEGRISSGKAAELLGLSRAAFLDLLLRHQVSPFQYRADELAQELRGA